MLLGHHNKHYKSNAIERDSEKIIKHEGYCHRCDTGENDIGLIKLAGPKVSVRGDAVVLRK